MMSLTVIAAQAYIASGNSGASVSVTTIVSSRISGDRGHFAGGGVEKRVWSHGGGGLSQDLI